MAMVKGDMKMPKASQQLLEAQAQVWNHILSLIKTMSLNCAIRLRIPDIIHSHGSPMSIPQLVDALPINKAKSQCIHRLMRLLVHSEFFVKLDFSDNPEDQEARYGLTLAGSLLLRDAPMTMAPFLLVIADPILVKPWHYMTEWLVSGEDQRTAYEIAHGRSVWEEMGHDLRLGDLVNESMSCDTRLVMSVLLKDYKQVFEGVELLVDVGGGVGTTANAILDVFPGMKCIVLDLPHVVAGLKGTENLTYVGGDMLESVPQGDTILLKWILHDWNDESCVRILKNCKGAISGEGRVIIIDTVLNDDCNADDGNKAIEEAQLMFDMLMMTQLNGKERSEKEWAKLFTDAGFTSYKLSPVLGVRSVIEVYP